MFIIKSAMLATRGTVMLNIKLHKFQQFCETIKHTLLQKCQNQTLLKFHRVIPVPLILYVCEYWSRTNEKNGDSTNVFPQSSCRTWNDEI